ncbi:DUF5309 family protein [uncultured Victivallis sp.]|uniref:SU10 major capsid protein n=1 Tax=uncultured Victivallis sp. TaxID=354118 RepID=UPI00206AC4FD|nr:DUF5309 family protein [uncultured Victivallis sp.]DAM01372.1 MAG TPA: Major capsid protein [Caudoviricetes sp.]
MDPAFSYSFQNQKRDLSDVLNTINKGRIGFISLFGTGEPAKSTEVEWLEDSLQARTLNVSGNSSGTLTITSSSVPVVGMLIQPDGKPDVFYVSTVTSATSIGVTLAGNNGGSLTAANAPTGLYRVISTPMNEGTHEGEGNNHQSEVKSNYTQIWRKEAALTRTAIQTAVYGLENTLDYQVKVQLDILSRELNAAAFFGQKVKRTGTTYDTRGQAGGLYYFAAGAGGLSVNAGGANLDDFVCNDGAQKIQDAGGNADVILCSPGQARVIGAAQDDKVRIVREDKIRGTFVAQVVNAVSGSLMTIIADDTCVPTDIWVLDRSAFSMRWLQPIYDWDPQDGAFDGVRRSILGEGTFEFKNILSRACRIYNVADAATALASVRAKGATVTVANPASNPVNTKAVTE